MNEFAFSMHVSSISTCLTTNVVIVYNYVLYNLPEEALDKLSP